MTHPPDPATDAPPGHPRAARLDRWRRPLGTRRERVRAWLDMVFADHGFLRWIYLNLHRVAPGAWRSAQPSPGQIARLVRQHGIRTVVNLRGGQSYGSLPLEIEACERLGVAFEGFVLRSRGLPAAEDIRAADRLFRRVERPVLFHCKSGADRAGMASALYLILAEGRPVAEARRQLAARFGHIRSGPTGVLDALFETYLAEAGDTAFLDWIETGYDPAAITARFRPGGWGSFLSEIVLRRE